MMRTIRLTVAVVLFGAACGGPKEEPKSEPKADPAPPTPSTSAAPDSQPMKAAPDSSTTKKTEGSPIDSAFGPKFVIDEKTGKVTPIKKTP